MADDLRRFAADLRSGGALAGVRARPVIFKAAMNIKRQLGDDMRSSGHFKGVARDIDFDILDAGLAAEIGPRSGRGQAGALANIAYFGSSRGGGTVRDPQFALEREAPVLEEKLADIMGRLL